MFLQLQDEHLLDSQEPMDAQERQVAAEATRLRLAMPPWPLPPRESAGAQSPVQLNSPASSASPQQGRFYNQELVEHGQQPVEVVQSGRGPPQPEPRKPAPPKPAPRNRKPPVSGPGQEQGAGAGQQPKPSPTVGPERVRDSKGG